MITAGTLLGGRVRYQQPGTGFRSGLEPVLLAAAVAARADESVLEAGTGAGAALLCLHARLPSVRTLGIEIDPALAAVAQANAQANGFTGMQVRAGAIETLGLADEFDHAIANPPYHPAGGTRSPDPARDRAKRGSEAMLGAWIDRLGRRLRFRGTLTLIVPAGLVPACMPLMAQAGVACAALYPLWPKPGRAAKLVILRGVRGGKAPLRILPGLVLHRAGGGYTDEARAVLEDAAALPLDGCACAPPG